ncbi:MAG: S16 family serine protease, partial [Nanoarchaeota archaeon]
VVGGPSAGGALTVLTIAVLGDLPLDNETVMTGTIQSGGLIGPVAGIKQKAMAAQRAGFKRVIVPSLEIGRNETDNLSLNVEIIPVISLEEALEVFTGKTFLEPTATVNRPAEYTERMRTIAHDLCGRATQLNDSLSPQLKDIEDNQYNLSVSRMSQARTALDQEAYYSAASLCFSANLQLRNLQLSEKTADELRSYADNLLDRIDETTAEIRTLPLNTISDLQTYMIVAERLEEAKENLASEDPANYSHETVAYAIERYNSAATWSQFFGMQGEALIVDQKTMQEGCLRKLSEAEDRLNYLGLFATQLVDPLRVRMKAAYTDYNRGNSALCMYRASIIKAEADVMLSSIAVEADQIQDLISQKLNATRRVISKQQERGLVPIMGISYYEYAKTLQESEPMSSLTFAQYALELSNLDMYFPKKQTLRTIDISSVPWTTTHLLLSGLIGIAIGALIMLPKRKRRIVSRMNETKQPPKKRRTPQKKAAKKSRKVTK